MERVRRRNAMRQAGMLGEGESAPTEDDDAAGGRPAGGGLRSAGESLYCCYDSAHLLMLN
jgi:hypothetical protein